MAISYSKLSKEQLIAEIKSLRKRKRFGLVWEDKAEEVAELCKTKLPVLVDAEDKEISDGPNDPTNILIEGDNYHALSVLNYTHKGRIDVIYIDPPYNTGAKDWKYNNHYIVAEDPYRHSKWLSFMEKRLKLAKGLLKPDGVLIVTIDEHEVHHLGVLLEQIYPGAYLQMVTIVINPKGVTQGRFARVEEYAFFCFFGKAAIESIGDDLLTPISDEDNDSDKPRWKGLLRSGTNARREDRKKLFYPVLVNEKLGRIIGVGDPLPFEKEPNLSKRIKGYTAVWPVRTDGSWGNWGVGPTTLLTLIEKGYVSLGTFDKNRKSWSISYLSRTAQDQIAAGLLKIIGHDKKRNVVDVRWTGEIPRSIKTVWHRSRHDAGAYGTDHLRKILGSRPFSFPKSIYSVMDTLLTIVKNKPNAIVLDFFAGSGTTGEAVLRLNQEYPGNRSFILCTNNENNICEGVCYPRIKKVIAGYKDSRGNKVDALGGSLKYFRTDFVDADPTDKNKKRLTEMATEMLCLKEGTFERIASKKAFKIYKNINHYTGIIFDQMSISDFKEAIAKIKGEFSVYVFSLGDDSFEEEFEDVKQKVKLSPIPEVILRVYRRIFK